MGLLKNIIILLKNIANLPSSIFWDHYLTSYEEKFLVFADILPYFVGNPIYHWMHLEVG
ncbi:glucuronate isomerase [Desulfosporosinus acididurans]|uniref:glucuronate isomerase n=1 Tax=Desulfosporosinus acididurans TaxID=476652 RepID=UPI000A5F08FF